MLFKILLVSSLAVVAKSNTSLSDLRIKLGEDRPKHSIRSSEPAKIEQGRQLFYHGQVTRVNGSKSQLISEVFTCNHCHHTTIEDKDLSLNDPDSRLEFANENNLAFLPGTTLYGSVNKTSWFNGDYQKRYGDLAKPVLKDFKEAIKLCSKECSKGRHLEQWEVDSILQYMWSLEYKIDDLKLSENEKEKLNDPEIDNNNKLKILDSKYLKYSDANFSLPPIDFDIGYGQNPDPKVGEQVFNKSCMHCHHKESGIPNVKRFSNRKPVYKYLYKLERVYSIPREGVFHENIYMPNYTLERMSDKQLDSLKSFLSLQQ